MVSPAFSLGWCVWQRHRAGLLLFVAYLLVLAAAIRIPSLSPAWLHVLTTPFGFGLLYLMGIFSNADSDLASTRSGYPHYLLTVPVRTPALVFWPMLYGVVSIALAWIVFVSLVLVPQGQTAFLWWPTTLLAALMACLQALSWYPSPLPYLRGILAFALLAALVGLGTLGWLSGLSIAAISAFYLALIPCAAALAMHGVSLARCGENRERTWLPERKRSHSGNENVSLRPFTSGAQAQLWLEWKRNGLLLPLLTFLFCALFALPIAFGFGGTVIPLGVGTLEVTLSARTWLLCLSLAPLQAMMIGCCPRKPDTFRPDLTLQPFLATRPLSCWELVVAKLKMAALSTLSSWAILLVFLAGWLLLPAQSKGMTGTIGGLLVRQLPPRAAIFLTLVLLCLIGWTWKSQVASLWIEFTGRPWIINGYAIVFSMVMSALIGWGILQGTTDPMFLPRMLPLLPYFAYGAAVVKALVGAGAFFALWRSTLVPEPVLLRFAGGWLLLTLGLTGLFLRLLPPGVVPLRYILLSVFLYLPLGRLLLAPLTLHWNRHR